MSNDVLVLIPTRNRSDLAELALMSVLDQIDGLSVRIVVSDNSTERSHSDALDALLARVGNAAARLIRPPAPLAMGDHWDWAVNIAIAAESPSHLLILTDRMAFKTGALRVVVDTIRLYPDEIVSYAYDRIYDLSSPVRFLPLPRTGDAFRIPSAGILSLSAQMRFNSYMPRMLNCAVPVALIEAVKRRFGTVCSSVSPDYCFCYRALAIADAIVYLDCSALVNYGQDRSNGASFARGVDTPDRVDFVNTTGNKLNAMTLLPQVMTVGNAVISEYLLVRNQFGGDAFPELSRDSYLRFLALEHMLFANKTQRRSGLRILRAEGLHSGTGFYWSALKQSLETAIVRMAGMRFAGFGEAFRYATGHASEKKPWLRFLLRKYQFEKIAGPELPQDS